MTSTRRLNLHSDVNKHPDESILLAYLRGQQFETHSSVIQHLENEKCPVCFQKLNELQQVTSVLDVLGTMRSHQYYPELTAAATYARIDSIAHQQISAKTASRPRKSAIRLTSVPLGIGLAIIFTAMLVFANLSGRTLNPFSSQGHTSSGPNAFTVVVNPHSAPAHPKAIPTAAGSSEATSETKVPHIKVCSTRANVTQLQLVICGFSFDSKHRVLLLFSVPGKVAFLLRSIPVDKHGKFHVEWTITDCGNMPIYIYGFEVTSSTTIRVRLHIRSFGACIAPPTPGAEPSTTRPKFGK